MIATAEMSLNQKRFNELFGQQIDSLETWQLMTALQLFENAVYSRLPKSTTAKNKKRRKPKKSAQEVRIRLRAAKQQLASEQSRPASYRDYLQSEEWANLRLRIMTRDKFTCVACGNKSSCVHHRSYDKETMAGHRLHKLISLCNECHEHVHFIDDEKQSMEITDTRLLELIVRHDRQSFIPEKMAKECKIAIWHIANGVAPLV